MKLHIPYLLGKIKLNEICPQDKKSLKTERIYVQKGKHEQDTWIDAGCPPKGNKKI